MNKPENSRFVGIDVGGPRKGFHLVCLRSDRQISAVLQTTLADQVAATLHAWGGPAAIKVVAIDSPCGWSMDGGSRQAERELEIDGDKIHCFSTPTRVRAEEHLEHARQQGRSDFYGWVRNGMSLFHALADVWPLYRGECQFPFSVETFPHAVACYLEGRRVARGVRARRQLLDRVLAGPISGQLGNADFVDAALCALAARAFGGQQGGPGQTYRQFGNPQEGFIVVPRGQG